MSFATRLKAVRMRSGRSLQDVADAIGVSKGHLWDLESGNSRNPSIEILAKLSEHFGVSIAMLAGESPSDETDDELKVMFRQLQQLDPDKLELVKALIEKSRQQARRGEGDDPN